MVTRRYEASQQTYDAKDLGAVADNLGQPVVRPFFALDLLLDDPLYFWTGLGELTLGGVTYTGAGNLLNVSTISETGDIRAANATVTLSGIPSSMLSLALQTKYHGRLAKIKFGLTSLDQDFLLTEGGDLLLQENGGEISVSFGDATVLSTLFVGYMDQMSIDEGPDTSAIALSLESKLVDLERPRIIRYTSEAQAIRFPNLPYADKAFEFVNDLQTRPLLWGKGVKTESGGSFLGF